MRDFWSIAVCALTGAAILGGCSTGRGGPVGPVVSPTGIVYELGTPPTESRYSQTATLYLRLDENLEGALELALEGIDAEPENPVHYFLAGVAHARLGQHEEADRRFVQAQRIYPAYELEIEPERQAAWAEAFNRGAEAYTEGDMEEAIRAWRQAARIFDLRPEAHQNLASALAGEGRYDEAIEIYQQALAGLAKRPAARILEEEEIRSREEAAARIEANLSEIFLFTERYAEAEPLLRKRLRADPSNPELRRSLGLSLSGQGRHDEAARFYDDLLSEEGVAATQLLDLGIALFRVEDFQRASQAFGRLTEMRPNSRDVWFNYVNALFAAEAWDDLGSTAERLLDLDPLSENAGLIAARARLEQGDEEAALRRLQAIERAPAFVEGLVFRQARGESTVSGRITGNRAEGDESVTLRFRFYGEAGEIGAESVTLPIPTPGETESFEVPFPGPAVSYRYELVDAGRF